MAQAIICAVIMHDWIMKMLLRFVKNNTGGAMDFTDSENPLISTSTDSKNGFDTFVEGIRNWWTGFTGTGLTPRDVQMNEMNMENVERQASAEVAGYKKAGVNPALMFSGGSNTAPQASASPVNGSMSEVMQALMLPLQMKMLNAQVKNVEAQTGKTIADTEQVKQIMDWYPRLSEANLQKLVSSYGVDIANINKIEAETAIAEIEKIIKQAEADNAPALYKARVALEEARTDTERAQAASALANAAWTEYETNYTRDHNGARPSSSSILALVDAISAMTGLSADSIGAKKITSAVIEDFKNPLGFYKKGIEQGKAVHRQVKSWAGNKWNQFKSWVNKEKRLF